MINFKKTIKKIEEDSGEKDVFLEVSRSYDDEYDEPGKLENTFNIEKVLTKKSSYSIVFVAGNKMLKTSEMLVIKGAYLSVFFMVSNSVSLYERYGL